MPKRRSILPADVSSGEDSAGPARQPKIQKSGSGRRRDDADSSSSEATDGEEAQPAEDIDILVKKLVRLALASEHSRTPLRRTDITAKVIGPNNRALYKQVWDQAQYALQNTFGVKLVELPLRDKVTVAQRRAAQRTEKTTSSSKSYVLLSTLPDKFRHDPYILPPPKQPDANTEAAYVGIYTFIISLIYLCGGTISESKLDRQLEKLGIEQSTPLDKTDKLLQKLCREGYLVRIKESRGGEEIIEFMVGPRGKLEVSKDGVFGIVKTVYGDDEEVADLEARLNKSLGLGKTSVAEEDNEESGEEASAPATQATVQRRNTRRRDADDSD